MKPSTLILAVDPGSETHGVVLYNAAAQRVTWAKKDATTADVCERMRDMWSDGVPYRVVVERVMAQRYAINSLLRTAEHGGWMMCEAHACGAPSMWLPRSSVLTELHVSGGGRDAQVRARMIELHGGSRRAALGTVRDPGPIAGCVSHAMQALGVAVAAHRRYAREGLWA